MSQGYVTELGVAEVGKKDTTCKARSRLFLSAREQGVLASSYRTDLEPKLMQHKCLLMTPWCETRSNPPPPNKIQSTDPLRFRQTAFLLQKALVQQKPLPSPSRFEHMRGARRRGTGDGHPGPHRVPAQLRRNFGSTESILQGYFG